METLITRESNETLEISFKFMFVYDLFSFFSSPFFFAEYWEFIVHCLFI